MRNNLDSGAIKGKLNFIYLSLELLFSESTKGKIIFLTALLDLTATSYNPGDVP